MEKTFQFSKQGAVDVLAGDVPLNIEYLDAAAALLENRIERGQPHIIVNLKDIPLIDSAGLELLVNSYRKSLERGGIFKIAAPNRLCEDILRLTGVADEIEVFSDTLQAAGSFAL